MEKQDQIYNISNPKLLSAIYFSILAILATIILDTSFYLLGVEQLIPLYAAIFLAVAVSALFGALFANKILLHPEPYRKKVFLAGFLMVLAALPIYDLGVLFLLDYFHSDTFTTANWYHFLIMYGFILLYSFILAGLWLAIAAGFAALYLRTHLAYDLMHSLYASKKINPDLNPIDEQASESKNLQIKSQEDLKSS